MKKLFANMICCLVPVKKWRGKLRTRLLNGRKKRIEKSIIYTEEYLNILDIYLTAAGVLPKVMSEEETLDLIAKGCSISRYGDGEFKVFDPSLIGKSIGLFQVITEKLRDRLREVLHSNLDKHIVAIIPGPTNFVLNAKDKHWLMEYSDTGKYFIPEIIGRQDKYGNAMISRTINSGNLPMYRKIWEGRKVAFVVSSKGRFVHEPELFDNIAEYQYIDIPPKDAFEEYDAILKKCADFGHRHSDWLFFISGGPMATILAYDLCKMGFWAADMGHLSNAYLNNTGKTKLRPEEQ
jgi:hypothetical protein